MTSQTWTDPGACRRVCEALLRYRRVVVTSHTRPDGDSIGSSLALAWALRELGIEARVVHRDPPPLPLSEFAGADEIEVGEALPAGCEAVVVLECGDLARTGLSGFDGLPVINVDHHPGNTGYGSVQWFDGTAAACGEMVFAIIEELGVPLSADMATQLFVAIVTDTGSFRYPGTSPRTFATSGRLVQAGADPVHVARTLFDSSTIGRLRLQAAVLQSLEVDDAGRLALLQLDDATLARSGGTLAETDGLINLPLGVKAVQAAVFFKEAGPGQWRVSLRSKGDVDVGRVARSFGGGGHKHASGCTLTGTLAEVKSRVLERVRPEIASAAPEPSRSGGR
ncbi:MAG TPA: bifunctional oligoribonuclease/PAP phosphatase NrnA [Vicinamibacterales bacterium]|nr:bifunctional oligoribonuclease/PAP phosphatase NrnA [Vicinamibacterales bacterium]HPW20638.1 bifunctional oligoribonuclease/PAP phosphatase NrnA [Vicinamibacterales bacterium]